jgi:hypothetical protein
MTKHDSESKTPPPKRVPFGKGSLDDKPDAPTVAAPLGPPCASCDTLMGVDAEKCPRCGAPNLPTPP